MSPIGPSGTGAGAQQTDTGERMLLTGSADDIAGDIGALAALGVRHVVLQFLRPTLGESFDLMTRFAEKVIPKVDA